MMGFKVIKFNPFLYLVSCKVHYSFGTNFFLSLYLQELLGELMSSRINYGYRVRNLFPCHIRSKYPFFRIVTVMDVNTPFVDLCPGRVI